MAAIILKKSRSLLRNVSETEGANLNRVRGNALFLCHDAAHTPELADGSVRLTVTSPPFLDVVQYALDNWLRGWFNGLPVDEIAGRITMARSVEAWSEAMAGVLGELFRVTRPGGAGL